MRQVSRTLPWRPATNVKRTAEAVRPIFWSNRPKAYLNRTADWDSFPSGRCAPSLLTACGITFWSTFLAPTPSCSTEVGVSSIEHAATTCRLKVNCLGPVGRWGNAKSPAYGTLNDYQFMRRHTSSEKRQEKARAAWGSNLDSIDSIIKVFVKYTKGARHLCKPAVHLHPCGQAHAWLCTSCPTFDMLPSMDCTAMAMIVGCIPCGWRRGDRCAAVE